MLAANVDAVFLVMSLNEDFNLRRLERYVTMAWESGAQPVIVLTKTDLCPDYALRVLEVEAIAFGVPVHAISSLTGDGLDLIRSHLAPGRTIALLALTLGVFLVTLNVTIVVVACQLFVSASEKPKTIANSPAQASAMPTKSKDSEGCGSSLTRTSWA